MSAIDNYQRAKKLLAEFRNDAAEGRDFIIVSLYCAYTGYDPDGWFGDVMSEVARARRGVLLEETFAMMETQVKRLREKAEAEARAFMEGKS